MQDKGIIVGCDEGQEWLLPWWWEHYSAYNAYPVVFVDFGMSKRAIAWCKERGECVSLQGYESFELKDHLIPLEKKKLWEACSETTVWTKRPIWFKKPFAVLQCPFSYGLWIDVDCRIKGSLGPIFGYLKPGIEIAVAEEAAIWQEKVKQFGFLLPGERDYNAGVIAFRKGAKILYQWLELAKAHNDELRGDQEALSRAIFIHKPPFATLPEIYNWNMFEGDNEEAVICHYLSFTMKTVIVKELFSNMGFGR